VPVKVVANGQPIDVFGCPSPNFEDFDGDGDLDLLCGEFLDGFTDFENVDAAAAARSTRPVSGCDSRTANRWRWTCR
jgi:hypothetical protein